MSKKSQGLKETKHKNLKTNFKVKAQITNISLKSVVKGKSPKKKKLVFMKMKKNFTAMLFVKMKRKW